MKRKIRKASSDYNSNKNKQQKQAKRRLQNKEIFEGVKKTDPLFRSSVVEGLIGQSESSDYKYEKEEPFKYLYEFTNARFLFYLGTLDSITYTVLITLIAITIAEGLNLKERQVVFALFFDIGDAMQTIVTQDLFIKELNDDKENSERNQALQKDFNYLTREIDKLRAQVAGLEQK